MTPIEKFASVTPPHELCRILAWRFHQDTNVFSFVLNFDVQKTATPKLYLQLAIDGQEQQFINEQ